jgi:hypothetical protein
MTATGQEQARQRAAEQQHGPRRANGANGAARHGTSLPRVEDIVVDGFDGRNRQIRDVFHKRRKYAIYEAGGRVMIQFSDSEEEADRQIASIAELFPRRDKLEYLVAAMRSKQVHKQNCYQAQIAEALRLGLENQMEVARRTLQGALENCMDIRETHGRISYMALAGLSGGLLAAILFYFAYELGTAKGEGLMLLASGGGALGALLSVAVAIRGRTVAIDGDWFANMLDGALRIVIGMISGGVLYLFMASGIVSDVKLGDTTALTGAKMNWHVALLIGFAAGFVERLLPNLLDKERPTSPSKAGDKPQNARPAAETDEAAGKGKSPAAGEPQQANKAEGQASN